MKPTPTEFTESLPPELRRSSCSRAFRPAARSPQRFLRSFLDMQDIQIKGTRSTFPDFSARLDACSKHVVFLSCPEHIESSYYTAPSRCFVRICPVCADARLHRVVRRYHDAIKEWHTCRFMTLTVAGHHPLNIHYKRMLDKFWHVFSLWARRHGYFRSYVRALEVSPHEDGWFYHFHVMFDGKYICFDKLQREWKHITGAFMVRISLVRNRVQVLNYLIKYIAKGCFLHMTRKEFFHNFYGIRFIVSYHCPPPVRNGVFCSVCGSRMHYVDECLPLFPKGEAYLFKPPDTIINHRR